MEIRDVVCGPKNMSVKFVLQFTILAVSRYKLQHHIILLIIITHHNRRCCLESTQPPLSDNIYI
jgi:hypothetical protein